MIYNIKNKSGFTLVEMLISITMFAVFIVAMVASYQSISVLNARSEATRAAVEETNTSISRLEQFARGLYLDYSYYTGSSYADPISISGNNTLVMRSIDTSTGGLGNIRYIWTLIPPVENNRGYIAMTKETSQILGTTTVWIPIFSRERFSPSYLDVRNLNFFIAPDGVSNTASPAITIQMTTQRKTIGKVMKNGKVSNKLTFQVQTTITPRNF